MFPRKKKNRTGTISVVVIDKSHGYKEVKFGDGSHDPLFALKKFGDQEIWGRFS